MSEVGKTIIHLPLIRQRACEVPGGPLVAVLVALQLRLEHLLEERGLAHRDQEYEKTTQAMRRAIGVASGMYRTPREKLDPESYAVEFTEMCKSLLLCEKACGEFFDAAVALEGGKSVCYAVEIFAPKGADLVCLQMLDEAPVEITVTEV